MFRQVMAPGTKTVPESQSAHPDQVAGVGCVCRKVGYMATEMLEPSLMSAVIS